MFLQMKIVSSDNCVSVGRENVGLTFIRKKMMFLTRDDQVVSNSLEKSHLDVNGPAEGFRCVNTRDPSQYSKEVSAKHPQCISAHTAHA